MNGINDARSSPKEHFCL